jgi:pimeloyl-ACP methyl ester carboxylesterase
MEPLAGLSAWMTGMQGPTPRVHRDALAVDGAHMHFLRSGNGPPLLLLHGLLGTAAHWSSVLPALASEWTVFAPDALGIGDSERRAGLDMSLAATADRLRAFMDAAEVGKAHILGTSHGGAVAMMLGGRHPERVSSLVLHAPVNPFSRSADGLIRFYTSRLGGWLAHRAPDLPRGVQRRAIARMFGDGRRLTEETIRKFMDSLRVPGTVDCVLRVLAGWSADMRELQATLPKLGRIPALLLWGDRDRVINRESLRALCAHFNEARLQEMPGAGHLPFEELPLAFVSHVRGFLRDREGKRQDESARGVA